MARKKKQRGNEESYEVLGRRKKYYRSRKERRIRDEKEKPKQQ